MLETISIIYSIYILISIYISVMQIGFIAKSRSGEAILLTPSEFLKSANYSMKKEKLEIATKFIDYLLFIFWLGFGLKWLDSLITIEDSLIKSVVFVNAFVIINWIVGLPFDIYQKFKLDKEFGFSNMDVKLFINDTLKGSLLFLIFGSLIIYAISYIIESFEAWWIYGFAFIFGIIIIINAIYPTLIAPIFNKFKPLEDEILKAKIEHLMSSVGFKSEGVFTIDASKRDNRLNAYFGGLGKSKRVVLFDTLIEKLNHAELIAVLGHELGHFKHKDILKNIVIMGLIMFSMFFIVGNLPNELFVEIGIENSAYSVIVLFLLISSVLTFFLLPIVNLVSRKNEYHADEFGSEVGSKQDLISALIKLATENRHFPLSHTLYIFFYYSHPPLIERLKRLGYKGVDTKE